MSELVKQQDLPPPGGYKSIPFVRQPAKSYFKGRTLFGIYLAVTSVSYYIYRQNCKRIQREQIEMRSSSMAIFPLLVAERDREYLKTLYRNREEEAKLMANVEGWKVGTWYGEPIFKTRGDDFYEPLFNEYYAHADPKDTLFASDFRHWT